MSWIVVANQCMNHIPEKIQESQDPKNSPRADTNTLFYNAFQNIVCKTSHFVEAPVWLECP